MSTSESHVTCEGFGCRTILRTRLSTQRRLCCQCARKKPGLINCEPHELVRCRYDEGNGSWHLIDSFKLRPPIALPAITGCIFNNNVVIRDLWSDFLYMTNLKDGTTQQAFPNQLQGDVYYCAVLDTGNMVYCDSKTGTVHLSTPQGKLLMSIDISHRPSSYMYALTVDNNGHIILGVRDGKIFVINPTDGNVIKSFSVDCKIEGITAMASGRIVVQSGNCKFSVINDCEVTGSIHRNEWSWARCVADPVDDVLYVVYGNIDDNVHRRVHVMSPTGEILQENVFELKQSPPQFFRPSIMMTQSRTLLACDNGELMIYRKICNSEGLGMKGK